MRPLPGGISRERDAGPHASVGIDRLRDAGAVEDDGPGLEVHRLSLAEGELRHPSGPLGRIDRVVVEHEFAEAVNDRRAAVGVDRLCDMRASGNALPAPPPGKCRI